MKTPPKDYPQILSKFELSRWLEEWVEDPRVQFRGMFGGLAVYFDGRQVLFICEDPHQTHYKDKDYGFPIWNGVLIPTEREHQVSLIAEFPSLRPHTVLPKWLYLPVAADDFDEVFPKLLRRIERLDLRIGILPGQRRKKKTKVRKVRPRKAKPRKKALRR